MFDRVTDVTWQTARTHQSIVLASNNAGVAQVDYLQAALALTSHTNYIAWPVTSLLPSDYLLSRLKAHKIMPTGGLSHEYTM